MRVRCVERDATTASLEFLVRDTGCGIAPDKLEAIFGAFSQADNSTTRKYGGTGLGLAICRQLTELMGGRIGVDSAPDAGSRFEVVLPLRVVADPTPLRAGALAGARALVASANAAFGRYLCTTLQAAGLRAEAACGGEAAV